MSTATTVPMMKSITMPMRSMVNALQNLARGGSTWLFLLGQCGFVNVLSSSVIIGR